MKYPKKFFLYQKASILRQGSAHVLTGLGNTKPSHISALHINSCRPKGPKSNANSISFLIVVFILLFVSSCKYDATPPLEDEIYDDKPILMISITGLNPGSPLAFRYWDDKGPWANGFISNKRADAGGNFLGSFALDHKTQNSSLMIFVDQDKDNQLSDNDLGFYRDAVTIPEYDKNDPKRVIPINIGISDFSNLEKVSPLSGPFSLNEGVYYCIFTPGNQTGWSINTPGNFYEFQGRKILYPFVAWESVSSFSVDASASLVSGSVKSAFLPMVTSGYEITCIGDDNINGYPDANENVFTIDQFSLSPGVENFFQLP